MSATNRGSIRRESDFYKTPYDAVEKVLDALGGFYGNEFLECCAGDGVIVRALRRNFEEINISAIEIREEEKSRLLYAGADAVDIADFRQWKPDGKIDVIITNPPYSIAQEIIEHCFEIAPEAEIIMLLRLAFLESKKRKSFWGKHPVTQIYVLSERPSFTGKGTDATAYAWFVWSKYREPKIKVI